MTSSFDMISNLPLWLPNKIFSYFDFQDLIKCRQVNWGWRHISNDRVLWEELARPLAIPGAMPGFIPSLTLLQLQRFVCAYESGILSSNLEIINKIVDFASKVERGQRGVFRCFIGRGSELECITLEIQGFPIQERVDVREDHRARSIGNGNLSNENLHRNTRYMPLPDNMHLEAMRDISQGAFTSFRTAHYRADLSFPFRPVRTMMEHRIIFIIIRRLASYYDVDSACVIG